MKKFFAVMLSLMLTVLTFASCQSTDKTNSTTNSDPGTNNTGKKYKDVYKRQVLYYGRPRSTHSRLKSVFEISP